MIPRRTGSIPKEDVFPRLLYSDSTCSQVLPGSPEGHYISSVNSGRGMYATRVATRHRGVVLATGPGNPPPVWVWTVKTGRFGSRPSQKPDPQLLGGPNPDPYPSTRGFRRVWLDPSVPISGSACRVSHLWSHSDMLLLIV